MEQECKVYLIREKDSNAIVYAGLTRHDLKKRWYAHINKFKFNPNHYQIELVADGLEIMQAAELERMLIKQYDLLENGWNSSPGSINGTSNYHSEKQKAKWSRDRKGKPVSEKHAMKNRTARKGHKNSESHKKAVSEKKSKPVMCLDTGIVFKSGRAAAKFMNLTASKISLVCNGKRPHTGGYKFTFVGK